MLNVSINFKNFNSKIHNLFRLTKNVWKRVRKDGCLKVANNPLTFKISIQTLNVVQHSTDTMVVVMLMIVDEQLLPTSGHVTACHDPRAVICVIV